MTITAAIPLLATHVGADGRILARASNAAGAVTPESRSALDHLVTFTSFVGERAPEALDQARDGLRIVVDERAVDEAVFGGDGAVRLGRAGARFLVDPIDHPVTIGHELTHALRLPDGNYMADELGADLVGFAYARSIGRHPADGADAWRNTMVERDLRSPAYATMDELRASSSIDPHHMAGPVGAAIARASTQTGTAAMDAVTIEAVLARLPRSSARVEAELEALIWSGDDPERIQRRVADVAMRDLADGLLGAADRAPDPGAMRRALESELDAVGVPFTRSA